LWQPLSRFPSGGGRRSSVHGRVSVHAVVDSRTVSANFNHLTGHYQRAAQAFGFLQAAALLAPNSEDIIHGVGRALMDLKREAEAVTFLVKATKLNPQCTDAWYDLGVTLSRLKQRKKARSCFVRALRLDQKYAWAYYDLACLDALERRRDAAFKNLERAIAVGFEDSRHLRRDADLRSLRTDARWTTMLATIRRPGATITASQKRGKAKVPPAAMRVAEP
jgi:Flp pilus assembly protein TadD